MVCPRSRRLAVSFPVSDDSFRRSHQFDKPSMCLIHRSHFRILPFPLYSTAAHSNRAVQQRVGDEAISRNGLHAFPSQMSGHDHRLSSTSLAAPVSPDSTMADPDADSPPVSVPTKPYSSRQTEILTLTESHYKRSLSSWRQRLNDTTTASSVGRHFPLGSLGGQPLTRERASQIHWSGSMRVGQWWLQRLAGSMMIPVVGSLFCNLRRCTLLSSEGVCTAVSA